jgi:DNA polymerase III epsilon subunit-like protein
VNIAVFDLETNGMAGSSVVSASSIVFNGEGTLLGLFNRFYLPFERPDDCAARVHGLTPGRLLELRGRTEAPLYFAEDWPSLLEFWNSWKVAGVVAHNLSFDIAFLPEVAQGAFLWWCSMKGLTACCAIPRRPGKPGVYKWPKLKEAADLLCDGPFALSPPEATGMAENFMRGDFPHVSLFDCFELYRVISRVVKHRAGLLRFAFFSVPFRVPKKRWAWESNVFPLKDSFTINILTYEQKLRSLVK